MFRKCFHSFAPAMTEINQKSIDVRTKIMACALELFKQYGFKSVTMDDVARRSGVSKKTLYQFFDNKNSIIHDTMDWYKQGIRCHCDSLMAEAKDAIEAFVKIKVHFDSFYKEINPIALNELQRFYPEGYQQFRDNLESDVAAVKSNLLQGIEEGLYRSDLNADILARLHMETMVMIMISPTLLSNRHDLFSLTREVLEHFILGVVTTKGEKLYRKYKEQYLKTQQ